MKTVKRTLLDWSYIRSRICILLLFGFGLGFACPSLVFSASHEVACTQHCKERGFSGSKVSGQGGCGSKMEWHRQCYCWSPPDLTHGFRYDSMFDWGDPN